MSQSTAIEWTEATWNPVHGCSKVSPGCDHCYAETLSLRYRHTTKPWTPENAEENVILKPHKLREPYGIKEPSLIFVNSMSDLFHPRVPRDFIAQVWQTMAHCPQHTFQILTKRPKRMREWVRRSDFDVLPNVWLGTSIENREWVGRADLLRETPAAVRFISAEPLLGPLVPYFRCVWECGWDGSGALDLTDIDWLIVGGESGAGHRPMELRWVQALRDVAVEEGTAFFFKQWGGRTPKAGGRELDGRTWDEMPAPLPSQKSIQRELA